MGTVYNQQPYYEKVSSDRVIATIDTIKNIQTLSGAEYYEVIQAYELALKIEKADTHDEQMSGFAHIFKKFTEDIPTIKNEIRGDVYFQSVLERIADALEAFNDEPLFSDSDST